MNTTQHLKHINLNIGRLPKNTTDEEWQEYFAQIKSVVSPAKMNKAKMVSDTHLKENGIYLGLPEAKRYYQFINSVLKTIRSGEKDYVFFVYQIVDLLKYEHRFTACYLPEYRCFELGL